MYNLTELFRQQEMPASNDVSICRKWMEVTYWTNLMCLCIGCSSLTSLQLIFFEIVLYV